LAGSFKCKCHEGYEKNEDGRCEVSSCQATGCENGGSCVYVQGLDGVDPGNVCICPHAYEGQFCEIAKPLKCPARFEMVDKQWCFHLGTFPVKYYAAVKMCKAMNSILAEAKDANENKAVFEFINGKTKRDVWLGGGDSDREGQWVWRSGASFGWTKWDQGQPSNTFFRFRVEPNEDCLAINPDNGKWNDLGCGFLPKQPYLCYTSPIVDDVDECSTNPCGNNADCNNLAGSFQCKCHEGYEKNEDGRCEAPNCRDFYPVMCKAEAILEGCTPWARKNCKKTCGMC